MRYGRIGSILCAAVFALGLFATAADARVGGGFGSGSRGSRMFAAPPVTRTAPSAAQPMQRSVTQPGNTFNNRGTATNTGGFFNRPGGLFGGGLLGGLAAGFIGAGLFGMLFGHGFLGGLGGFASFLGLLIQIALVVIVARLAFAWWQRRNQPAMAMGQGGGSSFRDMLGGGSNNNAGAGSGGSYGAGRASGQPSDEVGITPADYDAFEKLLTEMQQAYSNEDLGGLRKVATPEMVSYFAEDLAENSSRGLINRVSDVKLVAGDLSEAWRENGAEYATVAMRFSLVDQMVERSSGRVVQGSATPEEVTEIWTFMRSRGGQWILSAIQQV
jgi:predicted lipid-binding transport protein (Tim44 family)